MPVDFMLPLGMIFGLISWSLIFRWYIHPYVITSPLEKGILPILLLHTFRYIGLMFLVPGVTSVTLDPRFAHPAAYGDVIAAILAFVAIGAIRFKTNWALIWVWMFNLWGITDLVNAVTRGLLFIDNGHFGAAYWIPATIVPLLLVSHIYIIILLVKHSSGNFRLGST